MGTDTTNPWITSHPIWHGPLGTYLFVIADTPDGGAQHAEGKIEQRWYEVKNSERLHAVSLLLNHFRPDSSIAFCNTKQQCRDLVAVLQAQGFSALALFGELEQRERDQVLIEQLQGRESRWFPVADLTPTGNGPLVPPMVTIQIIGGRKEKIRAGDVLGALTGEMGYTREQIGKINVNDFSTYVAVDRAIGSQAAQRLNQGRVKGKTVKARLVTGTQDFE
eukprot:gene3113-3153_t